MPDRHSLAWSGAAQARVGETARRRPLRRIISASGSSAPWPLAAVHDSDGPCVRSGMNPAAARGRTGLPAHKVLSRAPHRPRHVPFPASPEPTTDATDSPGTHGTEHRAGSWGPGSTHPPRDDSAHRSNPLPQQHRPRGSTHSRVQRAPARPAAPLRSKPNTQAEPNWRTSAASHSREADHHSSIIDVASRGSTGKCTGLGLHPGGSLLSLPNISR